MDFVSPGSQAEASFFGIEASLEGLEPGYFQEQKILKYIPDAC